MPDERKDVMISGRVPAVLVERVDYVTRNTEGPATNRSAALRSALETWLPEQEKQIEGKLGSAGKKTRP